jgi:ParB-like chromosome segregation protein Spo0J
MKTELVKLSEVKNNPNNPRTLKDDKFHKLVKSIKEFPEMLEIRPIVVNDDMIVLGGNMRLKACKEAGLKEVHIIKASNLTEEQQKQFIIKDNVGFGEWDWDMLANEWDVEELSDWGLDVWQQPAEVDYSLLDDDETVSDEDVEDLLNGVKKAIQIEFEQEHFEEAQEVIKYWRNEGAYVGKMILDFLKSERDK